MPIGVSLQRLQLESMSEGEKRTGYREQRIVDSLEPQCLRLDVSLDRLERVIDVVQRVGDGQKAQCLLLMGTKERDDGASVSHEL